MWTLEYSPEAANYAVDSHSYNEAVLMALESLAQSNEGIPAENCTPLARNRYKWEIEGHLVLFRRVQTRHTIRILIIKPLE